MKIINKIENFIDNLFEKKVFVYSLLIFVTLISCLFLLDKGIVLGHDLEYHLSRIKGIRECLEFGDIKALIHHGFNNYGYPNGLFYSNLFLYFPAILNLFGVNIITSYKIFLLVCSLACCFSMYYCINRISNNKKISSLAAILYVTSSYRICDYLTRAAVGEVLTFIFAPIIIVGLYEIIKGDYKKFYIFSLGFVFSINSHMITTIIMFIISLLIVLLNFRVFIEDNKRLKYLIYSTFLGIGLGAFFIFPFVEQYMISDLIINTTETTFGARMPFEKLFVGLPNYTTRFIPGGVGLVFILSLIFRFKIKPSTVKEKELFKLVDLFYFLGFIFLLSTTNFVPWDELNKYFGFIQFGWRLLFFATLFLSISSAIVYIKYFEKKSLKSLSFVFLSIYVIGLCLVNQNFNYKSIETFYRGEIKKIYDYNDFSIAAGEYLPVKTDWSLIDLDERKLRTNNGDLELTYEYKNGNSYITYKNNKVLGTYIDVPTLYYRGYNTKSENKEKYYITSGYNTWLRVNLNSSESDSIVVYYRGTKILYISYAITLFTIISCCIFIGYKKLKK